MGDFHKQMHVQLAQKVLRHIHFKPLTMAFNTHEMEGV